MRLPFMPEILFRVAPRLGAEVLLEPEYGFVGLIRFSNGRRTFFWDNKFNLNPISSVKICQDKNYTTFFLKSLGYCVPQEAIFAREKFRKHLVKSRGLEDAQDFASSIGWPVFMKPCRLSQGQLVMTAYNSDQIRLWARLIFDRSRMMIIQRAYTGKDYRIVVLDGKVISAYERIPLHVVGNSIDNIDELLGQKQIQFVSVGRDTVIPRGDQRIDARLRYLGLSRQSIPATGEVVRLLEVSNLSLGGTSRDITSSLHPSVAELAIRVAYDLDLRFCGVDFLMMDAQLALADYIILEVNSAPGLDNYQFTGVEQQDYVDSLYEKVLKAISGSN